jgi:hypothetical protein
MKYAVLKEFIEIDKVGCELSRICNSAVIWVRNVQEVEGLGGKEETKYSKS